MASTSFPYQIVIADGFPLARQSIGEILKGEATIEVVGEAGDASDLFALLEELMLKKRGILMELKHWLGAWAQGLLAMFDRRGWL